MTSPSCGNTHAGQVRDTCGNALEGVEQTHINGAGKCGMHTHPIGGCAFPHARTAPASRPHSAGQAEGSKPAPSIEEVIDPEAHGRGWHLFMLGKHLMLLAPVVSFSPVLPSHLAEFSAAIAGLVPEGGR